MKTIITFFVLAVIAGVCAVSAVLYLDQHYPSSAFLSIVWIISFTLWIKGSGSLHDSPNVSVQ